MVQNQPFWTLAVVMVDFSLLYPNFVQTISLLGMRLEIQLLNLLARKLEPLDFPKTKLTTLQSFEPIPKNTYPITLANQL